MASLLIGSAILLHKNHQSRKTAKKQVHNDARFAELERENAARLARIQDQVCGGETREGAERGPGEGRAEEYRSQEHPPPSPTPPPARLSDDENDRDGGDEDEGSDTVQEGMEKEVAGRRWRWRLKRRGRERLE